MVDDPSLSPFMSRKFELSVDQGCLLWGSRVIIPSSLRDSVLTELHTTHPGMTRMKSLARSYVWWPHLDGQIEDMVSSCDVCQALRSDPPKAQVHPWMYPSKPWSRLHIDFAGPVGNFMYLVLVDAYSKFPEVVKMKTTTSAVTIKVLRNIFSRQGLPEVLVSDNGPQFVSSEFEKFCQLNGITHLTSAVHKPSTNGQAERVVQVLKNALKQAELTKKDVDTVLARYLLTYRNTPHPTTGECPSVLLMGRRFRTRLDLLMPSVDFRVQSSQHSVLKRTESRGCRKFDVGDQVQAKNFGLGGKWKRGVIEEVLGSRHYNVRIGDQLWKRHIDQLVKCSVPYNESRSGVERSDRYRSDVDRSDEIVIDPFPIEYHPSHREEYPAATDQVKDVPSVQVARKPSEARVETNVAEKPVVQSAHPVSERRYPVRESRGQMPTHLKDFKLGKNVKV